MRARTGLCGQLLRVHLITGKNTKLQLTSLPGSARHFVLLPASSGFVLLVGPANVPPGSTADLAKDGSAGTGNRLPIMSKDAVDPLSAHPTSNRVFYFNVMGRKPL